VVEQVPEWVLEDRNQDCSAGEPGHHQTEQARLQPVWKRGKRQRQALQQVLAELFSFGFAS
jgi:hypothetical protein